MRDAFAVLFADLAVEQIDAVARLTIALADGAFMAIEAGGIDLDVAGDVTADVLVGAIGRFEVSSLSTTSTRGI